MEELTKRNGKVILLRKFGKVLRRFDASIEWLRERIAMREEEMDRIGQNGEVEANEKEQMLRAKRMKSIEEAVEEVEVLIDTHFFIESFEMSPPCF